MLAPFLRRLPARVLSLLVLPFALASCDSGEPGGEVTNGNAVIGAAHVILSGAVTGTFDGSAMFTVDGSKDFVLMLTDGTPRAASEAKNVRSIVFAGEEGRPDGVSPLGQEEGLYTLYTSVRNGEAVVIATPDAGTATFTTSTNDRLAGHFRFTGTALDGNLAELGTVTVEGTFDAKRYSGVVR